jgi:outer membrane protein assembly factor BamD
MRALIGVVLVLLVSACASKPKDEDYTNRPLEDIYNSAMDKLSAHDYRGATKAFEDVDRNFPYSAWATKAQIMSAYSLYEEKKYDDAIEVLDRFVRLHPGNRDTPYAFYLKSLCYFVQILDVGHDQTNTENARTAFEDVIRRFPDNRYAEDARLKLDVIRDHLAAKELEIGRFYEDRREYLAAINRFRRVVDDYQTTAEVPEALGRLTECWLALGVDEEARSATAMLGHDYPQSQWYGDSYALLTGSPPGTPPPPSRGLIARLISRVF